MKKPLLIYGAGGLGREVISLIRASDEWEPAGFIDDSLKKNSLISGVPVLGGVEVLSSISTPYLVIAIGGPAQKKMVEQRVIHSNLVYPVLVHPSAILQHKESIRIGAGSIIGAGVILTTDILLGNHTLINLNSTVGHDCSAGNYCSVMPGVNIAGGVTLGESVLVGSGANILNRVSIGDHSTVGMGAVVTRDVPADTTVVGVPAKPIKR